MKKRLLTVACALGFTLAVAVPVQAVAPVQSAPRVGASIIIPRATWFCVVFPSWPYC